MTAATAQMPKTEHNAAPAYQAAARELGEISKANQLNKQQETLAEQAKEPMKLTFTPLKWLGKTAKDILLYMFRSGTRQGHLYEDTSNKVFDYGEMRNQINQRDNGDELKNSALFNRLLNKDDRNPTPLEIKNATVEELEVVVASINDKRDEKNLAKYFSRELKRKKDAIVDDRHYNIDRLESILTTEQVNAVKTYMQGQNTGVDTDNISVQDVAIYLVDHEKSIDDVLHTAEQLVQRRAEAERAGESSVDAESSISSADLEVYQKRQAIEAPGR